MNLIFLGRCWPSHQKCLSGTPSGDSAWVSASADVSLMNEKLYNRNLEDLETFFDLLIDQNDLHTSICWKGVTWTALLPTPNNLKSAVSHKSSLVLIASGLIWLHLWYFRSLCTFCWFPTYFDCKQMVAWLGPWIEAKELTHSIRPASWFLLDLLELLG